MRVEILTSRCWGCHIELFYSSPTPQGPDCITLVHTLNWTFSAGATTQWRSTLWRVRAESLLWYCENPASTGRKVLEVCDSHSDGELKEIPETSLLNFIAHLPLSAGWSHYQKALGPCRKQRAAHGESGAELKVIYWSLPSPVILITPVNEGETFKDAL